MAFRIKGLDHVVLRVADMSLALDFYCGVLGCREERRVERLGLVQLRAGAAMIDLVPASTPAVPDQGNMDHVAIRIEPFEEAALRAYLGQHGIAIGEVAQRYGAEGMGPSMYIKDPDGNMVELKGPPTPA
ncbi:MAG: VOC family protein [Alphaproteobacteria bacterium]|nr:VOC family protein [Alphaproteobacteria bacterium]